MGRIHQTGLDKMESIGEVAVEEEDSVAVDPVLNTHRNPGLELEGYKTEFGDHSLGYWVLTHHIGSEVGWTVKELDVHTLLDRADSFGLIAHVAALHSPARLDRKPVERNSLKAGC